LQASAQPEPVLNIFHLFYQNGSRIFRVLTQVPKELTFGSFLYSEGIKRRVARERVNDWDIFSLPHHKGGSAAFLWTYRKWFHVLPKSNWNNFIAAIRAPRNFKLVFYNFCYYFL